MRAQSQNQLSHIPRLFGIRIVTYVGSPKVYGTETTTWLRLRLLLFFGPFLMGNVVDNGDLYFSRPLNIICNGPNNCPGQQLSQPLGSNTQGAKATHPRRQNIFWAKEIVYGPPIAGKYDMDITAFRLRWSILENVVSSMNVELPTRTKPRLRVFQAALPVARRTGRWLQALAFWTLTFASWFA